MTQPTPEPQAYIDAQMAALLDPSSARDTVLVTPGSPMPSSIPDGLHVVQTRRGVVITKDPRKAAVIHHGNEKAVGEALFGYAHDQRKGGQHAVVATDRAGVPVAELATPDHAGEIMKALRAASLLAPDGGAVSVQPKQTAIARRLGGLLGAI